MSGWAIFWLIWFLVGLIAEAIALFSKKENDTLSEQVWYLIANPTFGKFLVWMIPPFFIWLIVHFITKGKWA